MKPAIHLYFDVISPYAWIAFETACRYSKKWAVDFRLVPSYLPGILKASGNASPLSVPARRKYLLRDIDLLGKHYQIPLKFNNTFQTTLEKGPIGAQRLLTSVAIESGACDTFPLVSNPPGTMLELVARQFWLRIWSRGEDITESASWHNAIITACPNLDQTTIERIMTRAADESVKSMLRANTQSAIDLGAFGLPVFHVIRAGKSDMIFGSDRMTLIADLVGESFLGPLNELSAFRPEKG